MNSDYSETIFVGDSKMALQAGFQRHIAKPVEPPMLIQAIAELRERSHD